MKKLTSAQETIRAAALSRRSILKSAVALGAVGLAGPLYIKNALSSSGELNLLMWSDEFPDPVIPNFEKATGIKVNQTPFSQNEEQINKLQATGGEGFDLCQPTRDRAPQFKDLGVLAPFDMNQLKNIGNLLPSMLEGSNSCLDLGWRPLPSAACLGFRSHFLAHRPLQGQPGRPELRLAVGRRREGPCAGPSALAPPRHRPVDGRATASCPPTACSTPSRTRTRFKKIYDQILPFAIEHKPWIKQFWDSADNTKSGLMENDVWIGQTWDGPALSLKKEGKPVSYQAPKEGAIAWLDGLSLLKAAKNVDQVYAFLEYLQTPEVSAAAGRRLGLQPGRHRRRRAALRRRQEELPGSLSRATR